MSASSKKKLRNEQKAAKMTEKQLTEQKEAKKLKLYTIIFVAIVAAFLVIAICVGITQTVANSGIREKNTTAVTIGSHEISNAELNYYYIDSVNNFFNSYGTYASLFGLDVTKPLDEQINDESTGDTWADYFISSAKDSARAIYAMNDAAAAEGFTLTEAETATIDSTMSTLALYGTLYGYSDVEDYLKAMYGKGATEEGYRNYLEMSTLADSYYAAYGESLTYEDADLRAAEAENYNAYSSYTYNYYYIAASKFLEGGTTDADGNTTYSDEEKAASVAAAEETANSLIAEEIVTVEDLDAAIAALSINAEVDGAASTFCDGYGYSSINSTFSEWVTAAERVEGDKTVIANTTTSTDEAGNETTTTNGYYVVYFGSCYDNTFALKNVRHILVAFEGGTTDSNGNTTYSDDEKAAAKAEAVELLSQWKSGEATEESFAALANEVSDDGDGTTGGLYENVYPGQMVASFEDWCYDASRAVGDTDIVESTYGYHIMYFVGDSDMTFRDYQITNELTSADLTEWYNGLYEAMPITDGNTDYLSKDLVLSNS